MKVRATVEYEKNNIKDTELGRIPMLGEVFEVTKERYNELHGKNEYGIIFVEKADKVEEKKTKKDHKFGIIMPNCNYSEWFDKSIGSIIGQTYQNFEIIFVDDMSTDESVAKAKKLIKDKGKVIELKQKRLNGGARNEAYLHLSKDVDYVMYVDSDDWLIDDYVLERINEALKNEPDVLFIGLAENKNDVTKQSYMPTYKNRMDAIAGWSGACGKVIKKELAIRQDCLFAEGTLKEDRNQHCRICINMDTYEFLVKPLYVWNKNNYQSVTTVRDALWKTSTIRHYADTLYLYLTYEGHNGAIKNYLRERTLLAKQEMDGGGDRQW